MSDGPTLKSDGSFREAPTAAESWQTPLRAEETASPRDTEITVRFPRRVRGSTGRCDLIRVTTDFCRQLWLEGGMPARVGCQLTTLVLR
jgi:hypothetical protein